MKTILLLFLFFTAQTVSGQDEYYVISVKGTIKKDPSGQIIKPGDRLRQTNKITFTTPNSAALLVSRTKGRFVMKPNAPQNGNIMKSLAGAVNDYLNLSTGNLSTRGIHCANKVDFVNFLSKDSFLLIGDTAYIRTCKTLYPLSDSTFFYLQYQFAGDYEQRKLENEMNKVKFIKSSVFMINGVSINPEEVSDLELFYGSENLHPSRVCSFHPCFVSGADLKATIVNYLEYSGYSKLPVSQQIDSIKTVINDYYGFPDKDELESWYNKNIKLPNK